MSSCITKIIISGYIANKRNLKFMKLKLTEIKEKIGKSILMLVECNGLVKNWQNYVKSNQ